MRQQHKSSSDVVFVFRATQEEKERLQKSLPPLTGNLSHHLLARKLVLDFIDGKLTYLCKKHQLATRT